MAYFYKVFTSCAFWSSWTTPAALQHVGVHSPIHVHSNNGDSDDLVTSYSSGLIQGGIQFNRLAKITPTTVGAAATAAPVKHHLHNLHT